MYWSWPPDSRVHSFDPILIKLGKNVSNFVLTISRPSSNLGHFGSITRPPGQILKNLVNTLEVTLVHLLEARF